jgi:uncharacterized protein (TIGR02145 family)
MLTNLAYGGGGNNAFGDAVNWLNEEDTQVSVYIPLFYIPDGANPTTYPDTPSTSTSGTGQFGYLYNWCAAMGNQPNACTSTLSMPNQNISICPSGWRLPTGGSDSEFVALNNAVNNGATNTDVGLRNNWLGMYSGLFFGDWWGQGEMGRYWSSVGNDSNPLILDFAPSRVVPDGDSDWGAHFGRAVRCIQ